MDDLLEAISELGGECERLRKENAALQSAQRERDAALAQCETLRAESKRLSESEEQVRQMRLELGTMNRELSLYKKKEGGRKRPAEDNGARATKKQKGTGGTPLLILAPDALAAPAPIPVAHLEQADKYGVVGKMENPTDKPLCWDCYAGLVAGDANHPDRYVLATKYLDDSWLCRIQGKFAMHCDFCQKRVCDVVMGVTSRMTRLNAELVVRAAKKNPAHTSLALVYQIMSNVDDETERAVNIFVAVMAECAGKSVDDAVMYAKSLGFALSLDDAAFLVAHAPLPADEDPVLVRRTDATPPRADRNEVPPPAPAEQATPSVPDHVHVPVAEAARDQVASAAQDDVHDVPTSS